MKYISLVSSLVDMYAECCVVDTAREVFDSIPKRDFIVCSSILALRQKALALFYDMQNSQVELDKAIMVSMLSSCSVFGALETEIPIFITYKLQRLSFKIIFVAVHYSFSEIA
ncbi:pentatricopeptide repeat-containing protein [Striga asiatica]|uniref:Pentatricopeptide repeat-containing protein n=1 Tax=Striga asiatica TaxID=4170 RepID=A0A5A7NYU2_STRAF|nr:pentatricopeptide repeat-containing protein [Striga asiatica]